MGNFIAAERLIVLNDGELGPTFQTAKGYSYIDVTLFTERTLGKINSWILIKDLVTTSHALLEGLIGRGNSDEQSTEGSHSAGITTEELICRDTRTHFRKESPI